MGDSKCCAKCGEVKGPDGFNKNKSKPDGLKAICRDCDRKEQRDRRAANPEAARKATRNSMRRWALAHPEEARAHNKRWQETYKAPVFDHYGHQCACCGAAEDLTVDHINGDGAQHRAELGTRGSYAVYRWLVRNNFPDGFQVLCFPCNRSKSGGGRCRIDHTVSV